MVVRMFAEARNGSHLEARCSTNPGKNKSRTARRSQSEKMLGLAVIALVFNTKTNDKQKLET